MGSPDGPLRLDQYVRLRRLATLLRFARKDRSLVMQPLDEQVWNPRDGSVGRSIGYEVALLEQYRLFAELADRHSQRRGSANRYFLSLNGAALVAMSGPWATQLWATAGLAIIQIIFLFGICVAWYLGSTRLMGQPL